MPLKTHVDPPATLNLTPMVDVVFLLIIFFLAGTKFSEMERRIELEVPEVADVETLTAPPAERLIQVCRDGRILLDREPIEGIERLTERLERLRGEYAQMRVRIAGDADNDWQRMAEVLAACRTADVKHLGIDVRPTRVVR